MPQTDRFQGFNMNFDQYIADIKQDFRRLDQTNTGSNAERVTACSNAIDELNNKITWVEGRMDLLSISTVVKRQIVRLLKKYETILDILYAMREWFKTVMEDYEAIIEALRNRDFETAEEIQAGLELESGNHPF